MYKNHETLLPGNLPYDMLIWQLRQSLAATKEFNNRPVQMKEAEKDLMLDCNPMELHFSMLEHLV